MNEYIIIYQSSDQKPPVIEKFFRQSGLRCSRLGKVRPYLGRIQSDMDADQFAEKLRSNPMNKGSLLFSVNKAVLV